MNLSIAIGTHVLRQLKGTETVWFNFESTQGIVLEFRETENGNSEGSTAHLACLGRLSYVSGAILLDHSHPALCAATLKNQALFLRLLTSDVTDNTTVYSQSYLLNIDPEGTETPDGRQFQVKGVSRITYSESLVQRLRFLQTRRPFGRDSYVFMLESDALEFTIGLATAAAAHGDQSVDVPVVHSSEEWVRQGLQSKGFNVEMKDISSDRIRCFRISGWTK